MRRGDKTTEKMAELKLEAGRASSSGGKSRTRNLPRSSRSFWRQVEGLSARERGILKTTMTIVKVVKAMGCDTRDRGEDDEYGEDDNEVDEDDVNEDAEY